MPTIYDLLSPAQARPKTFRVGSREFDPVKVGLAAQTDNYWIFDTSKDGNHNTGHEFRAPRETWKAGTLPKQGVIGPLLSSDERLAIIEHLKVRNDDTDGPTDGWMPPRSDCPPPPNGGKRIR